MKLPSGHIVLEGCRNAVAFALDPVFIRMNRLRKSVYNAGKIFESLGDVPGRRPDRCVMLTLTYRGVSDWSPEHISDFLRRYKSWCLVRGFPCRYVWTMELQKRGAPHYHVLVWVPSGTNIPFPDKKGWWTHGWSNRSVARKRTGYLMKYVSKVEFLVSSSSVRFPKGARIYGVGGLDKEGRRVVRFWKLSKWLRDLIPTTADIRKVSGGWVDIFSGLFYRSPWKFMGIFRKRPVVFSNSDPDYFVSLSSLGI